MSTGRLRLYGDFNCPWSYLASRRAELLAGAGFEVDWRAVEHEPDGDPRDDEVRRERVATVQQAMERINGMLLPGELLPYSLAGFVPNTGAALAAYADACSANRPAAARHTLFEAFWCHSVDLDNTELVRTVVTDLVDDGSAGSADESAGRLVDEWRSEWRELDDEVIPVVIVDDAEPRFGVDAVSWLGEEVERRELVPDQ